MFVLIIFVAALTATSIVLKVWISFSLFYPFLFWIISSSYFGCQFLLYNGTSDQ